ncbi:hypothetical protein K2Q00_00855 [Patescibacteria group bacterium]|nr:hypothetical protein [Patescibacteria group bacterium]
MKKLHLYIVVSVLALPLVSFPVHKVFAGTSSSCSAYGYTVAFINGSFDTLEKARSNTTALELLLPESYKKEPITVVLAYNPIHLAGVGDMVETVSQMLFNPISNYDFYNLLRELSQKDATQKLLLVGHSQGALYANSLYEHLTVHDTPPTSIGLYAVATPANYVAGGGTYINSYEDAVIFSARAVAEKMKAPLPLPNNVDLSGSLALPDLLQTHGFLSYVQDAKARMVSDIYKELSSLKNRPGEGAQAGPCLMPPAESVSDHVQKVLFAVADPVADTAAEAFIATYRGVASAVINTLTFAWEAQRVLGAAIGAFSNKAAEAPNNPLSPQNQEKNFGFIKKLYGSSLDQETYEELNSGQGASVALALISSEDTDTASEYGEGEATTTTNIVSTSNGGTGLPPPQAEISVDTVTSSSLVESTASTTPSAPTEIASAATSTPSSAVATTSSQTPPPFTPEHSPINDTFNAFNRLGWQTFGQNAKNFDFDDGEDGECFRKGCAVGMGGNAYDTLVPRMFIQKDPGLASGAYTLYVKARAGFNNPFPAITICATGYDSCLDNGSTKGINFLNMIPLDDTWHHYYFAWKQGDLFVQSCFMQDYVHFSDCVWVDTDFAAGTTFNGIALWSTNGWRADVPPHANLWFDELDAK